MNCAHGIVGCGPVGSDTGIRANPKHCDPASNSKATLGRVCAYCVNFVCLHHVRMVQGKAACIVCQQRLGGSVAPPVQKAAKVCPQSAPKTNYKTPRSHGNPSHGIPIPPESIFSTQSLKTRKSAKREIPKGLKDYVATNRQKKAPLTDEIVAAVIKRLKKPKQGVGVVSEAKRHNVCPNKLSAALKSAGFVVKKGRKA